METIITVFEWYVIAMVAAGAGVFVADAVIDRYYDSQCRIKDDPLAARPGGRKKL